MRELFPDFLDDPHQYELAVQYWQELWNAICDSDDWETGWLNTAFKDGTPFNDGDGILNAISRSQSRAFKVVQTPLSEGCEFRSWSTQSALADPSVELTVMAGPLTLETAQQFKEALERICRRA